MEAIFAKYEKHLSHRCLYPDDVGQELVDDLMDYCEEQEVRFQDPQFPPSATSMNRIPADEKEHVGVSSEAEFTPANEFCENPRLFVGGISPTDIRQGGLGDCWLCGAIATVASRPACVKKMFYPRRVNDYGVYSVRFSRHGVWYRVIVDDSIPCSQRKHPVFISSADKDELWSCLVEKAYAKIHGSYQDLVPVCSMHVEPLVAFTGGKLWIHCPKDADEYFELLKLYLKDNEWYVTTGSDSQEHSLVSGHAYSVLDCYEGHGFRLCKLRNTWGAVEWNGSWSDNDEMWEKHPEVKQEINPTFSSQDGIFWIAVDDALSYFSGLRLCRVGGTPHPHEEIMNDDYCWSADYEEHLGTENFQEQTKMHGSFAVHTKSGGLVPALQTQYLVYVDQPSVIRANLKRTDDSIPGYPWMTICKPYNFHTENKIQRDLVKYRLQEDFFGDEEENEFLLKRSSFDDWFVVELDVGTYTIVPCCMNGGDEFDIILKCDHLFKAMEIPAAPTTVIEGEWADGSCGGRWNSENPMFTLTLPEKDTITFTVSLNKKVGLFEENKSTTGIGVLRPGTTLECLDLADSEEGDSANEGWDTQTKLKVTLEAGSYPVVVFRGDAGRQGGFQLFAASINGNKVDLK